jgi:hypothetical protein
MSNETAARKYVSGLILGHVSQIESHATAVGIPDTNYCIKGVEGWIEMKYVFGDKKVKVRPMQWTWFRKRLKENHTRLFFMLRWEYGSLTNHYLIRVRDLAMLERLKRDLSPQVWAIEAAGSWAKSIPANELNDILTSTLHWRE